MRDFCTYISLLFLMTFPLDLSAQIEYVEPWNYSTLIDNDISEISCYEFISKSNGKLRKDSSLIYYYKFDKLTRKLYGDSRFEFFTTHGKLKHPFIWQYIENTYDSLGNLISEIWMPNEIKPKKQYGSTDIDSSWSINSYKYNKNGVLQEEKNETLRKSYSISKYTKDTFYYESNDYKIYSTEFDNKDRPVKRFLYRSSDSSKYLNVEWLYDKGLLSKWISYTKKGDFHTKRYYLYDNSKRLIEQIDSTGWYINGVAYLQKRNIYTYDTTGGYIETIYPGDIGDTSNVYSIVYDLNNNQIKRLDRDLKVYAEYFYEKGLLMHEIYFNQNQKSHEIIYKYHGCGLLTEKFEINYIRPEMTRLTKYYYK